MDEAMKSLRQEYVTEFYIKELEKQMGYWFVKKRRPQVEALVRDVLEKCDETTTLGDLLSFFHSPYMVMCGVTFCIILNMTELMFEQKKEEKING